MTVGGVSRVGAAGEEVRGQARAERSHRSKSVFAFLENIEQVRKSSIGTRNRRLWALHSFFSFVADREPLVAAQCAAVLRIPTKQAPKPEICALDEDEITAILAQPDRSKIEGQRDHVLLAFLFNTGARIQEALDLSPQALRLESPFQVRLFGKGRKERICPLWPETVELLKALLKRKPRSDDDRIFVNRYGKTSQSLCSLQVEAVCGGAAKQVPSLTGKRVSPHPFRPRDSSLSFSRRRRCHGEYQRPGMKAWTRQTSTRERVWKRRRALEKVDPSVRPAKPPRWKRQVALLEWLDSL